MSSLRSRVISAAVAAPAALFAAWQGGPLYAWLVAIVLAKAAFEYSSMLLGRGREALTPRFGLDLVTLLTALGFARAAWVSASAPALSGSPLAQAVAVALVAAAAGLIFWPRTYDWPTAAMAAVGGAYVGWLGGQLWVIRALPDGRGALLAVFAIVWATDMSAYFVGRRFGRRKLAPRLSPKKSVEGAIGGLLGAVLVGVPALGLVGLTPLAAAGTALAVSTAGQLGDLFESGLKRHFGFKDSGAIMPGHGGALDRIDSLLFAIPVYLWLVGGG